MENEKLFELMEKMYIEMQSGFSKVNERFEDLEKKVDKNTILLEKARADIKLIAEVQQSFQEQLGKSKDTESKSLNERLDIIELAVTNNSITLNEKIDNLQIDVNNLTAKTALTDNKVIKFEGLLNRDKKHI